MSKKFKQNIYVVHEDMYDGDPRGPNVIPFGRRTLAKLRRANQMRPAPPERGLERYPLPTAAAPYTKLKDDKPWPFNALGPSPYHDPPGYVEPPFGRLRDTMPTSKHDTLPPVDAFHFRNESAEAAGARVLEFDLDNVLIQYKHDHPGTKPLDLVVVLLQIVKKLLRMAKLPPR